MNHINKFRLKMILIQNIELNKFTAYFSQFPEVIVDGETEEETERILVQTLGYFLDYKNQDDVVNTCNNHIIQKNIDFNYEIA